MSAQKVTSVDVSTGAVMQLDPVFTVPGLIPVVLASSYQSDLDRRGPLGWNRVGDVDAWLVRREDGRLAYRDGACLDISFAPPTPNPGQWNPGDHRRTMDIAAGPDRTFMVREEGTIRHFAKSGPGRWHLTAIEAQTGLRLEFERDDAGLLAAIALPEGLRVEFDNDPDRALRLAAHLVGRDGGRSCIMRYEYDAEDNLTLADCPHGDRHDYGYDDQRRIVRVQINGQFEARYGYDAEGRCTHEQTNGPFDGTRFDYDPERRITRHTPAGDEDRAEYLYYNEDGAVFAEGHIWGRFNRSYYDIEGNVVATQDGLGNRVKFAYDPRGHINQITDAEGRISDFRWSEDGQMEYAIDHTGATWEATYDETGALIEAKDALGHDTMIRNNDAGQPTGICRHDGHIQFFDYDDQHWLTRMVDFDGIGSDYERDEFGRTTAVVRDDSERMEYDYEDQEGYDFWTPSRVRLPGGQCYETTVVEPRRQIRQTDPGGRTADYVMDGLGKVVETRDAGGGQIRFVYDAFEELAEVHNQAGQRWSFERDAMGRMIRETDFGGAVVTYDYDDADRLIGTHWPDGTRVELELDKSGRVTEEVVQAPGADPETTGFDYDDRGLACAGTNAEAEVSFTRDDAGQVVEEVANGHRITSEFDCCGRRTAVDLAGLGIAFAYDPAGRLRRLTVGDHAPLEIDHDGLGNETARRSQAGFSQSLEHDSLGLLTRQVAEVKLPLDSGFENYTPEHRTRVEQTFGWTSSLEPERISHSGWGSRAYRYTGTGQLAEAVLGDGARERFRYDQTLGIEASQVQPPQLDGAAVATAARFKGWQAGPDGRIQEAQGPEGETIRLRYDAKGRVVERKVLRDGFRPETTTYDWNGQDRMVAAHTPDGAKWTYGYDAFARRVFKQEWHRAPGVRGGVTTIDWVPAARHDYLWDGDVMVRETITATQEAAPRVIHWIYLPDSFVPLAREEAGHLSYVICDHLGTPQEVVAEDGTLEWAGDLATWGRLRRVWVASAGEITTVDPDPAFCPIRFQGQWSDAETGLSYNRFRYFDPLSAAFIQPDPIRFHGGLHLYEISAAPTRVIDPMGLQITYLPLDSLGRPTGAIATLTNGTLGGGTAASSSIRPPGFVSGLPPHCHNRGHLIGRQLGGSGRDRRNLVTLTNGSNSPAMRQHENAIRDYLRRNPRCTVIYTVTPIYDGNNPIPVGVTMNAVTTNGHVVSSLSVPNGLTVAPC